MRLAFVLFHYFPYGGLERDMLAMANLCQARGHEVVIFTGAWQGDKPANLRVEVLPLKKTFSNAGSNAAFVEALQQKLAQEPGWLVIGFNKMPQLDFYYAADTCFAAKAYGERGALYRMTPRAKQYLAHEEAVFAPTSKTQCFMISRREMATFQRIYGTPLDRLHLLPPGFRRDRVMPDDYAEQRAALRKQYGLLPQHKLVLMVGSDFKRKGLERAIRALAALPSGLARQTLLWVAGQDKPDAYLRLAAKLGVDQQVRILGARDDVSQLLWSADAFLHPAHSENTGTVILEAMVAGLPAVVTDVCGYAPYVGTRQMGEVIKGEVTATKLAHAIESVLTSARQHWLDQGRTFAQEDIYSMTERAAELIERLGQPR